MALAAPLNGGGAVAEGTPPVKVPLEVVRMEEDADARVLVVRVILVIDDGTGVTDTGVTDTGVTDTGVTETGVTDTGVTDGTGVDSLIGEV